MAARRRRRCGAAGRTCLRKAKWSSRCSRRPRVLAKYASIAWGGDVISPPHALVAPSLLDSPQHSSRPASGVADGLRCNPVFRQDSENVLCFPRGFVSMPEGILLEVGATRVQVLSHGRYLLTAVPPTTSGANYSGSMTGLSTSPCCPAWPECRCCRRSQKASPAQLDANSDASLMRVETSAPLHE